MSKEEREKEREMGLLILPHHISRITVCLIIYTEERIAEVFRVLARTLRGFKGKASHRRVVIPARSPDPSLCGTPSP